ANEVNVDDVPAVGVATEVQPQLPQHQLQPSQDAGISMDLLQNLLDTCTTLTRRVENLEHDKVAQDLKITKLKQKVKKLERKSKASKLQRLKKVGTTQRIKTSDDTAMDDVSKHGRIIADMDPDVDVTLKDVADVVKDVADVVKDVAQDDEINESTNVQGRQAESQAQIYQIDLEHPNKVLSMQDDDVEPAELQEVVEKVFANIRRVGKGCSGVETPLFEGMIVAQEVGEGANEVNVDDVPAVGVATEGEEDGTEGPMIIEAEIGGHCVHRTFVDGGSSLEILYEHYFSKFLSEIKNHLIPANIPLVGFIGEIIWLLGQISLLVKIGDEEHSTSAWMNFMVTSVAVKKANDVMRLQALVDKKKVIITKATIRDALYLDDVEGVECLPNEEIFTELARMGYEKPSTKLTFYKAFFSSQ
nr:reverse transcriptase domain-containing protein [Tanacetum cinerariifolium]